MKLKQKETLSYLECFSLIDKIRLFENTLFLLFEKGKITGTTHTCVGQEFISYCLGKFVKKDDFVFSSHRSHGHFISMFDDVKLLLSEITGINNSINMGRGGSQHIFYKNFFSYGVQGGYMPIAAGVGFSKKNNHSKGIVVAIIGDGTFGEGTVYESLNIISKFEIPILIIIEDNKYAQSTSIDENFSGTFKGRSEAFDIPFISCSSFDINGCLESFEKSFQYVNKFKKPLTLHVETYRFNPHSKSDETRDIEEIGSFKERDPYFFIRSKIKKPLVNKIEIMNQKVIKNALKDLRLN